MKTYASTNREINNTLYSKRVLHSSNKNILQKIISNALTTCFLLIPESVNREIKQQRKQHLSAMIVDPDYLKQA
jgi:hypothetical protein